MMPAIQRYPNAILTDSSLQFTDLGLDRVVPPVSVLTTEFPQWMHFTVLLNQEPSTVWFAPRFLALCLNTPVSLLEKAAQHDQLLHPVFLRAVRFQLFETTDPLSSQRYTEFMCINDALHQGCSSSVSSKIYRCAGRIFFGVHWIAGAIPQSVINQGISAVVKQAITLNHEIVARRTVQYSTVAERVRALHTVEVLQNNSHNPGVIPLLGFCLYSKSAVSHRCVTFFPEYPRDLLQFINHQPLRGTPLARSFAKQLVNALASLQGAHRDLKPENILIHPEAQKLVLIDFDSYWGSDEPIPTDVRGTPGWAAPEAIEPMPERQLSRATIDVWPLGQILYYLLTQSEGFSWQTNEAIPMSEALAKKTIEQAQLLPEFKELLLQMLVYDPQQRITLAQVAERVQSGLFDSEL